MSSMDLSELRKAIGEIDQTLLELLGRRMKLAAEGGKLKAAEAKPVVVPSVEDKILTRARQHAEEFGVSEKVMEDVFQAIIRGSVERQHRIGVEWRRSRGGRSLILGGSGGMGTWFRRFLPLIGHRVDFVDPLLTPLSKEEGRFASLDDVPDLAAYDHVVVSVPLANTPEVLLNLVRRKPPGLVVEISSIKSHLEAALTEAKKTGVRVSCLHPMFGPGKSPYEPLSFVLAAQGDPAEEKVLLETFLRHPYTRLIEIPFSHHDRLMGWLLGLAHLSGMLFGAALKDSGLEARELETCASTTFKRQAETSLSILSEDPDLYLDIQRLNPHRQEVYGAAREALEQLIELVESDDKNGFAEAMSQARKAVQGNK